MGSRRVTSFAASSSWSALALLLLCCGGDNDEASKLGAGSGGSATTGGVGATSGASSTNGGVPTEPPPERETETSFQAPVATGKYLWTANPESGRVAVIDTEVLDIRIADAGFGPTYLAAVPGEDSSVSSAIVINVLSHDATFFSLDGEGQLSTKTFPIHAAANQWTVSSGGEWAAAWTDAREVTDADPTDGFQDISLINLSSGSVTRLSVGYRPTQVVFDAAETRMLVVSEPGISRIDLEQDTPETIELVLLEGGSTTASVHDVSITRDGRTALVRVEGQASVKVLALEGGESLELPMGGVVTDLDLSDDGTRAVAVMRAESEVSVLDVPRLGKNDSSTTLRITDGLFGSVALSPSADIAVLYTNALDSNRVTILELEAGDTFLSYRTVDLKAPVQAVFVAPDGEHAIALLDVPAGSAKAGAFSVLVTKAERAPKIVGTDAPATFVAISSQSPATNALITTRDDETQVFNAYLVSLPSLQVDAFDLASPPLAAGIIADVQLGYVAQAHPEGRITFMDLERAQARTLTGFELATKVVD